LGEVTKEYIERTTVQNQYAVLTSSQQAGVIRQEDYFAGRQITTDENVGYFVLPEGYFTYRSRSDNDVFIFNRNDLGTKGIISYYYPVFEASESDSDFLLRRINNGISDQIAIAAEGTGQHVLSMKKFASMVAKFPTLPEQARIGELFHVLDALIAANQRKADLLKQLKRAYLQMLFPEPSKAVPKLRFPGFTGAWEQRKLGQMGTTFTGLSGKAKDDFGHGDAEFITYMNVFANTMAVTTPGTESVEIDPRQSEVRHGDVLFTTSSETPDEVGMSSVWLGTRPNVYLNSFCFGWRPTVCINKNYLGYVLRSPKVRRQLVLLAQGISRYNISKNKAMEVLVPTPCAEEQQRVGNLLVALDHLITLHQRKCDRLQDLKHAYLQKMLV